MINAAVDLCWLLLCADLIARRSFIDPGHLLIYSLVTRLVSYQKGKTTAHVTAKCRRIKVDRFNKKIRLIIRRLLNKLFTLLWRWLVKDTPTAQPDEIVTCRQ
jgi:hypothetical protein